MEKIVEYIEGMSYGRGYNRLTGEALPSRAVTGDTARIKNAGGQRVSSSCRITTDVQTLQEMHFFLSARIRNRLNRA